MAMLKKAATIAVVASAGVMGTAGIASAQAGDNSGGPGGDNTAHQAGLLPINALNNVNISPNLGCLLDQTAPNLTAQSLVGLVPIGVSLNHLLEHTNLNLLANGNTTTEVYDNSCTSNQGSSQAGNNSHGSTGAGSSSSVHDTGNGAGSHNSQNGEGAGGLIGGTTVLSGGTTTTSGGTVTPPPAVQGAPVAAPVHVVAPVAAPMQDTAAVTGTLAHTGADIGAPLAGAGAALLGGLALQLSARRRHGAR